MMTVKETDGVSSSMRIQETLIVEKSDRSVTVYPKAGTGNTYTVYPRGADGTQVTVTMTSEGKPILLVRDAEGNIIPPKE